MLTALLFACVERVQPVDSAPTEQPTASSPAILTPLAKEPGPSFLREEGVLTCADPAAREALGPWGLGQFGAEWEAQRPQGLDPALAPEPGAGLVVADLTGDGLIDVFLPNYSPCMLFVGQPDGSLADESVGRIPGANSACSAFGASAGDADGDGDFDLYVARDGAPDWLWFNDGTGHFTDGTPAAGFATFGCASRSASWGDMDLDGDLDLFVARHRVYGGELEESCPNVPPPPEWSIPAGDPNSLYENQGDGTFIDRSERLSFEAGYGHSFIGAWQDADGDGLLDLFVINDFGRLAAFSTLYLGDGAGNFDAIGQQTGLELSGYLMAVGVGDFNEDGRQDYAISDIDHLHLMLSGPGGIWYNAALALGMVPNPLLDQRAAWGIELADVDNDSLLDVMVAYGQTEGGTSPFQPDALFLQGADGTLADHATAWGIDGPTMGRGIVLTDLNQDGWLDLVRTNYRHGPAEIWLSRCGTNAWLDVGFEAPNHGYGARVEVRIGDRTLRRWHQPSSTGLAVTGPPRVHFGLAEHDVVDELTVYWPGGPVSRFYDVDTRQRVTVVQPPKRW